MSDLRWTDPKRHLWLVALVMPLLPFAAVGLHSLTDWGVWLWLGPLVILGVVPLIDAVAGRDSASPPDELIRSLEADRYYRWLTYAFLPLQYAGFVVAMAYVARGGLSTVESVGLSVTVGFIGGLGINTAHELGHKRESHERWLSKIALAQTAYGHFYVEHNRGHHVRVATPADPASSRLGESYYRFWPRTVFGSVVSAWRVERRRYARDGRHPVRLGNDVLNAWAMTVALWLALLVWLGSGLSPYLVLQALVGLSLLEAVNYLEHYGLLRERVGAPGHERWERIAPKHSWNSNNIATNVLLYHLQRHSDHHANPTRRYQALRDHEESPILPTGYAAMILLALVPPAWRRVMDPRVAAHYGGDLSRANVVSRRRPVGADVSVVTEAAQSPSPPGAADDVTRHEPRQCPGCGYVYDALRGDAREGFPAGTPWSMVPDAWSCPDCGVRDKGDFVMVGTRRR